MSMTEIPTFKCAKRLATLTGLLCCLLLTAVACGQRGPLYLPEQNSGTANKQPPNGEEENTAEKKDTEEDGSEDEKTP